MQYPEHEKLQALKGANQTVGEFLEWLEEDNVILSKWGEGDALFPIYKSKEDLIAGFFGIDQNKLEAEKRQMLEALRSAHD